MYKSRIVKLVLLNSVLVLSGCGRCQVEEKIDEKGNKVQTGCTGSRGRGGVHFFPYFGGGSRAVAPTTGGGSRTGSTGSGAVGRGGFGGTGGAVS